MDMKERWKRCEQLSLKLKISKGEVFNFLSVLDERGLSDRILADDEDAIREAMSIDRFGRPYDRAKKTSYPEPRTALEAKAQDIQVMLWAIRKIGDKERARAAFNQVMRTLADT